MSIEQKPYGWVVESTIRPGIITHEYYADYPSEYSLVPGDVVIPLFTQSSRETSTASQMHALENKWREEATDVMTAAVLTKPQQYAVRLTLITCADELSALRNSGDV